MDVLFRSIGDNMLDSASLPSVLESIQACDPSEAALSAAPQYLESVYSDNSHNTRANSRAATPMLVGPPSDQLAFSFVNSRIQVHRAPSATVCSAIPGAFPLSPQSTRLASDATDTLDWSEQL